MPRTVPGDVKGSRKAGSLTPEPLWPFRREKTQGVPENSRMPAKCAQCEEVT